MDANGWRRARLLGGLSALWVAVGSPLATLDHRFLTFHMVQHLLLMTVAAPLILLGTPPTMLPRRFIRPVFCWLASTVTLIAWHVPALFDLGMRSEAWHATEHACFFAAGLLFWLPVVQLWEGPESGRRWSVPLYLFLATLPCDALGAFLAFCNRVVYPHYRSGHSPLADQEFAGALMWVWVTFAYLAPAAVVIFQLLSARSSIDVGQVGNLRRIGCQSAWSGSTNHRRNERPSRPIANRPRVVE